MFTRPVYPRPFYQRGYSELDAVADDLEYRASLVRQAARSRLASAYEPASQYWNVSAFAQPSVAFPQHDCFCLQSTRQPYYEPTPYRHPRYDYEPGVPPQLYTYEPDPEYQGYYGYEYPAERHVVRRPSLYAPNDAFYVPDDASSGPIPGRVAPHIRYVSHPPAGPQRYLVTQGPDEYVRELDPHSARERDRHLAGQRTPVVRSLQKGFTEPPKDVSLVSSSAQRTSQSSPARHSTSVMAGRPELQDMFGQLIPEERDADQFRRVPTAPQQAASGERDLEVPRVWEKSGPAEQRSSARNEPQASANSFQDFISQIADLVLGQQQQQPQPNSQRAVSNQRQEAAAQSKPVVCVQFAPQPQSESNSQTQSQASKVRRSRFMPPKTADSLDPFHYQATEPTPETSYTYAAPACAQHGAIPKPTKLSGSPALPVPGRTFQHIRPNPQDPGAQPKPGAADEVADIMEAIRRSLDRNEHVKPASSAATPAPVQAPAVVASSPNAAVPGSVAVTSIRGIEERFVNLTYDFKFPSSPDFPDPSTLGTSPLTAVPELLHTHANQPIHAYETALVGLLTELDAVDSAGDDEVRHARKEVVNRIERELEKVETLKNEAWQRVISSVLKEFAKAVESAAAPDAFPVAEAGAGANSEVVSQRAGAGVTEIEGYTIPVVDAHDLVQTLPEGEDTPTPINNQTAGVEVPIQAEDHGASPPRRAPEPITSFYPLSSPSPRVATRARQSSSPPPETQDLQTGGEIDHKSLGSSPVEIPSELSEFGDEDSSQELQQAEDEVPPSMEESALLERKHEFVLL